MEPIHPCAKQEGNAFCREIVEDNVRTIDLGRDNAAARTGFSWSFSMRREWTPRGTRSRSSFNSLMIRQPLSTDTWICATGGLHLSFLFFGISTQKVLNHIVEMSGRKLLLRAMHSQICDECFLCGNIGNKQNQFLILIDRNPKRGITSYFWIVDFFQLWYVRQHFVNHSFLMKKSCPLFLLYTRSQPLLSFSLGILLYWA